MSQLMVAVTLVKSVTNVQMIAGILRSFETPEDLGLMFFYPLRDSACMPDGQSLRRHGWIAGEVQVLDYPDDVSPRVSFLRCYNLLTPLRDIPLGPRLGGVSRTTVDLHQDNLALRQALTRIAALPATRLDRAAGLAREALGGRGDAPETVG